MCIRYCICIYIYTHPQSLPPPMATLSLSLLYTIQYIYITELYLQDLTSKHLISKFCGPYKGRYMREGRLTSTQLRPSWLPWAFWPWELQQPSSAQLSLQLEL